MKKKLWSTLSPQSWQYAYEKTFNNVLNNTYIVMDQITIKTPNPKCRLYWHLMEFIDWRHGQSCWYFRPLLWTSAPLTFSLVHLPPPSLCEYGQFIQGVTGGRGEDRVVWDVFEQILNLQNCFTTPNKNLGGEGAQTDKHLPPIKGQFLRKSHHLG